MNKSTFDALLYINKNGINSQREIAKKLSVSLGTINKDISLLKNDGFIDEFQITEKGKHHLEQYKVKNAIIMAAGMSSRFVPLSYEIPKGLLVVKDEVIIERQIKQLQEAGIKNITIVIGYMKEKFFYLEEKFGVKLAINTNYNIMNNPSSLLLVEKEISNSYICSSDNYFEENVFEEYVYTSYYASTYVEGATNEYCITAGANDRISKVNVGGENSWIMIGHVYWDKDFAQKFIPILKEEFIKPGNQSLLWEDIYLMNIKKLNMTIKKYSENVIFEFDNLEELRSFDEKYVKKTSSKIIRNICNVLKCSEDEVFDMQILAGGLTNSSFVFKVKDVKYVYRHPGVGTEEIINRKNEFIAQTYAKQYDIDPSFIHMNEQEGWKISYFIENAKQLDYYNEDEVKKAISLMRKLHDMKIIVDFTFDFESVIDNMEKKIIEKNAFQMNDYTQLKNDVFNLYNKLENDNIPKVLVHNDCYDPNFLFDGNKMYLIDWEYAALFDVGGDLGTFICCSSYNIEEVEKIIKDYLGNDYTELMYKHLIGYVAIMSFYWFVWALYKEACGEEIGEYLLLWYRYSKQYLNVYNSL